MSRKIDNRNNNRAEAARRINMAPQNDNREGKGRAAKRAAQGEEAKAGGRALGRLARRINASHQQCLDADRDSLEHARQAGVFLLEAKEKVRAAGHPWERWVQENCRFTLSTAQRYMRVAEHYYRLLEQVKDPGRLTLTRALRLLSRGPGQADRPAPAAGQPIEVASPAAVHELARKAGRLELTAGSAEQRFVESRAAALAKQVLAAALRSKLKDGHGQPVPPGEVAIALLVRLKKALSVALVVRARKGRPEKRTSQLPAAIRGRLSGKNGKGHRLRA
jgi:hypothetical protein